LGESPQEFTEIGFIVELHKTTGGDFMGKEQKLFEIYHKPNTSAFNDFNSDYSYVSPDTIWSVSVDDYAPPCINAYTMDTCEFLSKYATPSSGEAQLYVKLGEGNEEITRPLIFVEGIDFDETTYTDVDGNIIRHGGNGWENIIQGLSTSKPPRILESGEWVSEENNLFRNYPAMLKSLTDSIPEGEAQYDIILIDFKDGADYIQKNGQLVIEAIKKINISKGVATRATSLIFYLNSNLCIEVNINFSFEPELEFGISIFWNLRKLGVIS